MRCALQAPEIAAHLAKRTLHKKAPNNCTCCTEKAEKISISESIVRRNPINRSMAGCRVHKHYGRCSVAWANQMRSRTSRQGIVKPHETELTHIGPDLPTNNFAETLRKLPDKNLGQKLRNFSGNNYPIPVFQIKFDYRFPILNFPN